MALLDWLWSLFGKRKIVRDVSGMTTDSVGDQAATRQEVVNTGGTLRPDGRRLAIRDRRLLPKPKPTMPVWSQKKPKILPRVEADRLFAGTLRTKDRNIRDLLADTSQLQRYGLPKWMQEGDVATALGLTVKQLRHYSVHRPRETTPHYVTFAVAKRSGGVRLIYAPKRQLKSIQRQLNELLVKKLPVSPYAHGFRQKHSVVTNATPHLAKKVVIKLDLKDCFPSIHFGRVRSLLIGYGYSYPVAQTLSVLMTEAPRQPVEAEGRVYHVPVGPRVCVQGAPTSPGICNAILRRMDFRLAGLARKHEFAYTRYADDLTFSGDDIAAIKALITLATRIAREEGFAVNREKTRVQRAGTRQAVTGVIVNQAIGLSRQHRRRLRAELHRRNRAASDASANHRLTGKLAYLRMLNPAQADALIK